MVNPQLTDKPKKTPGQTPAPRAQEANGGGLVNAMTVDVEDYFQVSAFDAFISRDDWDRIPARVCRNIDRILELFAREEVKATFFTLGWVAQKHPSMIRNIAAAGHEIASHGEEHTRIGILGKEAFFDDVDRTKKQLEDISGLPVVGYRAPSFSITSETTWAYDALSEAGYEYSSSVYPIAHDHYGLPDAPRFPYRAAGSSMLEIPISSLRLFGRNWPGAGGGYFRLLPVTYAKWVINRNNKNDRMPSVFYFHPWEIDPDQPRVQGLPARTRFRHYVNLGRFEKRLRDMLSSFRWGRMDDIFLRRS